MLTYDARNRDDAEMIHKTGERGMKNSGGMLRRYRGHRQLTVNHIQGKMITRKLQILPTLHNILFIQNAKKIFLDGLKRK